MNLEIYLFWTDNNGQQQQQIENYPNWSGAIPRLKEHLVYYNHDETYLVEFVRHDIEANLVSISAVFIS